MNFINLKRITICMVSLVISSVALANNFQTNNEETVPSVVDFLVSEKYTHPQSTMVVYTKSEQYLNTNSDIITRISVFNNKNEIWTGSGSFSEVVFSENGRSLLLINNFESKIESIVITDKKVKIYDYIFNKQRTLEFDEPFIFHQISNNGHQVLSYHLSDGNLNKIFLCTLSSYNSDCDRVAYEKSDEDWQISVKLTDHNNLFLLHSNRLERIENNIPSWQVTWKNDIYNPPTTMLLHKNLIIVTSSLYIKVSDNESGLLLWKKTRSLKEPKFGNFNYSSVNNDYLIMPLNNSSEYGRKNLSIYLK